MESAPACKGLKHQKMLTKSGSLKIASLILRVWFRNRVILQCTPQKTPFYLIKVPMLYPQSLFPTHPEATTARLKLGRLSLLKAFGRLSVVGLRGFESSGKGGFRV